MQALHTLRSVLKVSASLLLTGILTTALFGQVQPGTVLWSYDVGNTIVSSPALGTDGAVYVGCPSALYAITNAGSIASNKWVFGAGPSLNNSSSAIGSDGTVYFIGGTSNALFAVSPGGNQKWVIFKGGGGGTPAIGLDNTIYFQDYTGFYAITPSGDVRWKSKIGDSQPSSPVVGPDGTIYVFSHEFWKLYALSPDGSQKLLLDLPSAPGDSPAIGGSGLLYVPVQPLTALSSDGNAIWSLNLGIHVDGPPVTAKDGSIYISASGSHTLYAVTPTGLLSWLALGAASKAPSTSPAIDSAGNIYYCVSNSVVALTPRGDLQWTVFGGYSLLGLTLAATSPIIGPDGTVYAAIGSTVYAIAQTNRPADSSWPMYRGNAQHTGRIQKPSLQNPKKRADANFEFQLFSQTGTSVSVESSTNFTSWNTLTSLVPATVPEPIVDLTASNSPVKFYRAKGGG